MKLEAKNALMGLLMLAIACGGLWLNGRLALGTARQMGPGYMPMLVFGLLGFLGIILLLLSSIASPTPTRTIPYRDGSVILASLVTFALLIERGGLALAVGATVAVSALANGGLRLVETIVLACVLGLMCWWIFIWQLDVHIPLWPVF